MGFIENRLLFPLRSMRFPKQKHRWQGESSQTVAAKTIL